jgi:flagellin
MGLRIRTSTGLLENNVIKANEKAQESMERLSSGVKFTKAHPMPMEQAISQNMTRKIQELVTQKKIINESSSLVEVADSALSQINNLVNRMSEIKIRGQSPELSDQDRQISLIEYNELYKEVARIAETTEYNGFYPLAPSLNKGKLKEIKIDLDAGSSHQRKDEALSIPVLNASPDSLGLIDLSSSLPAPSSEVEGLSLSDYNDLFAPGFFGEDNSFSKAFDQIDLLRTTYGAITSRLTEAKNYSEVYEENLEAARSRIRDVDYAQELTELTSANILANVGLSVLSHSRESNEALLSLVRHTLRD